MHKFKVEEERVGERLDSFVTSHLPLLSRAFVQKLCDTEKVLVNGSVGKPGLKLRINDRIEVDYNQQELADIPKIDLPILYEDDDCIVLNKPVGVLTHSQGPLRAEGTVATFLRDYVKDMEGERAGVVHRLDRATSGVIICAKNQAALSWLQKQFAQRRTKKTYYALIEGTLDPPKAIIDMPIERNPKQPQTFRVGSNGKESQTAYEVEVTHDKYSKVRMEPTTGRTHQLRVHMHHQGHPILGDTLYGGKEAQRLFLHAYSLEITLPNRERKTFIAPLPPEFDQVLTEAK